MPLKRPSLTLHVLSDDELPIRMPKLDIVRTTNRLTSYHDWTMSQVGALLGFAALREFWERLVNTPILPKRPT